jgi:hypothetical protein
MTQVGSAQDQRNKAEIQKRRSECDNAECSGSRIWLVMAANGRDNAGVCNEHLEYAIDVLGPTVTVTRI